MPEGSDDNTRSPLQGTSLESLGARARSCELCRLCDTRTSVICGEGNPDADIMFVADGPGYRDDRSGHPLSGVGGELLDELLGEIGLTRADVWITSVVKCRTPDGRTSFPDEIELCEGYLFREVALVQPRIVCALGNVAIRLLTGRQQRLSRVHGTPIPVSLAGNTVTVLPLYHPGAVAEIPVLRPTLRTDFRTIPRLLRAAGTAGTDADHSDFDDDLDDDVPPVAEADGAIPAATVTASAADEQQQMTFDLAGD